MKPKKILITGGSGFIGKNLVDILGKKNYKIFCLVRKNKKSKKNLIYLKSNFRNKI